MRRTIRIFMSFFLCSQAFLQAELPEISSLSLREKIAQLCIVAAISNEEKNQDVLEAWSSWEPRYCLTTDYVEKLIRDDGIGGVIFYGKHTLPQEQLKLTQHFQTLSRIPLLIALDAEKGLAGRFQKDSVLAFPYNMTLGAVNDIDLTYQVGKEVGEQLKAIGVHLNFAPVVDVNNNPQNPVIGMRSFGSDKEIVANLGIAFMQGLQDAGIIACAKHFPGHGDTTVDSHEGLPLIAHSRARLDEVELYPFQRLIAAGVQSVMLAHLEVPALEPTEGLPSSLSHLIATEILQEELGFKGLVVTDALGMKGVTNGFKPGKIEVKALQAGADILLCPIDTRCAIDAIEKAVREGVLNECEIDKKVQRVWQAKEWAFKNSLLDPPNPNARLHTTSGKELKRTLYSKAVTLVKSNNEDPFDPELKTAVINVGDPLIAFESTVKDFKPIEYINLSIEQCSITKLPIAEVEQFIVALQEDLFKNEDTDAINQIIKQLKNEGKKVCLVLFCSPYFMENIHETDTIVLAYENDPDAQIAAAELIFHK